MCVGHQIPGPTGSPIPAPPLPFAAPLTTGLASSVLIGGRPAAVVGSAGINVPAHVGLHPADPFLAPPAQRATVTSGSPTVLVEGKPMASMTSSCTMCMGPALSLVASAATVLVA
jgi:uncharacterized Zn-binding protein involved in type VI secretion